jgi:hypothetical protein
MPRAKTKTQLIESSQKEFKALIEMVDAIPEQLLSAEGVCEVWSVKDILAHLHAWHMLFLTWYQVGMGGDEPPMPAPGLTWKQTPELNEMIYQEYKDEPFDQILISFQESFQVVFNIIKKHSDRELFTKKLYSWTGSTSLGSYLVSSTASHYSWAQDLIKKWKRNNPELFTD